MKKTLIILLATIGIWSCTDLEEISYERIPEDLFPENEAQLTSLAVQAYSYLRPLIDDEGWWFLAQEISSDELVFPTRGADWDDGGKWRVLHQHSWNNDVDAVNKMWSSFYEGTAECNKIIERFNTFQQTEATINKIKEIEIVRAFYFYLLMDNYGDIPYVTQFAGAPENPVKLERTLVWDSLVTTLEENLPALDPSDKKYKATRYMAFALLSKLYLNAEVYTGTAQWEKADSYIDSILAGPYALATDVSEPFSTENQASTEIIFSIPFDEDDYQGFRLHMRTLHYQHTLTYDMSSGPWNGGGVTYDHFKTYTNDDLRKQAYFIYGKQYAIDGKQPIIEPVLEDTLIINPYVPALVMNSANNTPAEIRTSCARIGKFEIKKGVKENLSNDFPLFRLSDFYLMKAETQIRLNGDGAGDDWINPIRERAELSPWSGAGLDSLLAERGRELFCEGHRRQDLIRFGEFTKSWWGKGDSQGGIAGDNSVETFPIPLWAVNGNPNLAN